MGRTNEVSNAFPTRFWDQVDRTDDLFSCWLWQGNTTRDGYGKYPWRHPVVGDWTSDVAHRVAFYLTHGELPECVMHSCDVPACVRPEHLVGGTMGDNIRDAQMKGRLHRGPRARFTKAQVAKIRQAVARGASERQLAKYLRVHFTTISNMAMGKTYKSYPGPTRKPRIKSRGPRKNRSTHANTRPRSS